MPYTWFIRVPGLSIFREADRMTLLALVGAALLAGAAVEGMTRGIRRGAPPGKPRRAAWPSIAAVAVVAVLAILEAGWPGSPQGVKSMPTTLPALDRPI